MPLVASLRNHAGVVDKTWGWDEAWQRGSVRRTRLEIFLAAIEIAPRQQNHGIASQLIRQLLDESDQSHLPVKLQVLKVNPARRLYERSGFVHMGETPTHIQMVREPARR